MRKPLINRNQCWEFEVIICDDPTDKYISLGIETDETFFPLHMKGTTCGTITRDLTDEDLEY